MRLTVIPLLGLLLTACQIDPYTHQPHWTGTDWYGAGKEDAMDGVAVKSRETLAANFNDPKVDRPAYLKGYKEGQKKICQENFVYAWGLAGRIFPPAVIPLKTPLSSAPPGSRVWMKVQKPAV